MKSSIPIPPIHDPSSDDPTAMVDCSPGQRADDPQVEEQFTFGTIARFTGHNVGRVEAISNVSIEIGRFVKADLFKYSE